MYQALYRQYRPKTFDQVLGQEHITTTIKNQIQTDNIGHAYLFSGTRGTGKTSTAKIFSRAVNCLNPTYGNPCNECEICKGIMNESIMDIIEMDAASNRKIDDIRELRDKVMYPPSRAKYKIYIMDEVHMLTNESFNALLKILEEPPKHLIFILATTEMQKLPQTIISRCQRFDFKRITTKDLIANMKNITDELEIKVEDEVLSLIARNSDGAMRDSLSLLEQCISYKKELTYEDALNILGIANTDLIFSMVDNIKNKDLENALSTIDNIIQEGKDIKQFLKDLIYHFRNLLLVKTSDNPVDIMDMGGEMVARFKEQSGDISLDFILKSLDILNTSENQALWSTQPRIILEMTIIKLSNLEERMGLEERVKRLESAINNGQIPTAKSQATNTTQKAKTSINEEKQIRETKESKEIQKEETELESANIIDDGEEISIEVIKDNWNRILKLVKEKDIKTNAFLREGKPLSILDNRLLIAFKDGYGFHKEAMDRSDNKEIVEKVLSSYFHKNITIKLIMEDESMEDGNDKENDILKKVTDVFGSDIVEIE